MRTRNLFLLNLGILLVFTVLLYFLEPTERQPPNDPFKEYADSPGTYFQKHLMEGEIGSLPSFATVPTYPPIGQQSASISSYSSVGAPDSYAPNSTSQKSQLGTIPSYPDTVGQHPVIAPSYSTSGQQFSTLPSYPSLGQQGGSVPFQSTVSPQPFPLSARWPPFLALSPIRWSIRPT